MLVLGRKENESVIMVDTRTGERVGVVTLTRCRDGKGRMAFESPAHIKIARSEVYREEVVEEVVIRES
jgi:sRNA-binding carbon storage regulator CsrA